MGLRWPLGSKEGRGKARLSGLISQGEITIKGQGVQRAPGASRLAQEGMEWGWQVADRAE